ncbi:MAG TPA: hypothetical protein VGM23_16140 [Armatimonadota bacterium]|jgi:hypothetical protein
MQAEDFRERKLELAGWPVNITSYQIDKLWHAKADNVSPGAALARATGATREEAEQKVMDRAAGLLGNTRRMAV